MIVDLKPILSHKINRLFATKKPFTKMFVWCTILVLFLHFKFFHSSGFERRHDKHLPDLPSGTIDEFNSDLFELLTKPPVYNRHLPPQEERPINVNISIFMFGFGNIEDKKSEFNFELLMRIVWNDERLRPWNATIAKDKPMTVFEGGSHHLARLWTPSLHVPNSRMPSLLDDKTLAPVLTRIQSDGKILVSKRLTLHGLAQMDFRLYPLDIQKIPFVVESNELSHENLMISWREQLPLDWDDSFDWNGFHPVKTVLGQNRANYTHTGTFSRVTATFYLKREFGQFLLDVYIPLILYCIVAYGSCWIEITAAPGRIALGVTILLTMVTTAKNARENLPSVSYIHALDVFITVCTVFVIATFVEFIIVNYFYYKEKRSKAKISKRLKSIKKRQSFVRRHRVSRIPSDEERMVSSMISDDPQITISSTCSKISPEDDGGWSHQRMNHRKSWTLRTGNGLRTAMSFCCFRKNRSPLDEPKSENREELAYEIDRVARICFPIAFLIFNIIYWVTIIVLSSRNMQ